MLQVAINSLFAYHVLSTLQLIQDEEVTLETAALVPGGAGTVPLLSLLTGSNFCISIQASDLMKHT